MCSRASLDGCGKRVDIYIYIFIYLFIYYLHYIRQNGVMREEAVVDRFSLLSWNLYEESEGNSDQRQGSWCCSCD